MRIKPTAPLWQRFLAALAPLLLLASVSVRAQATAGAATVAAAGPLAKQISGHSAHGSAFDAGPRQKPWKMEGIGHAPFPITTKNPEAQTWFDQGNALLIDKQGRVYWGRFGGDPFTDLAFLEKQLKRMNDLAAPPSASPAVAVK